MHRLGVSGSVIAGVEKAMCSGMNRRHRRCSYMTTGAQRESMASVPRVRSRRGTTLRASRCGTSSVLVDGRGPSFRHVSDRAQWMNGGFVLEFLTAEITGLAPEPKFTMRAEL